MSSSMALPWTVFNIFATTFLTVGHFVGFSFLRQFLSWFDSGYNSDDTT